MDEITFMYISMILFGGNSEGMASTIICGIVIYRHFSEINISKLK